MSDISPSGRAMRRLERLRATEARYLRDALGAARLFADAGRPRDVDAFIRKSMASVLKAQKLARRIEDGLAPEARD